MKKSSFNSARIIISYWVYFIVLSILLLNVSCTTKEERCLEVYADEFIRKSRVGFEPREIGTPVSIIHIFASAGNQLLDNCDLPNCVIADLRYIVYTKSKTPESEEVIFQQGRIPNPNSHITTPYKLLLPNNPSNSDFRIVVEGDAPDCLRDENSRNFKFEYEFSIGPTAIGLKYEPNFIIQTREETKSSTAPIVLGEGPFTYDLALGLSGAIIDENTGVITVLDYLISEWEDGTYPLNVRASNESGSTVFPNAFRVIVARDENEKSLVYRPDSTTITTPIAVTSPGPSVIGLGDPPFTFSLENGSELPHPGITIDSRTGVIATTAAFGNNTYSFDVNVTNGTEVIRKENAYTLIVALAGGSERPSNLVYSPNTVTQNSVLAVSSPTPTVAGTPPFIFSIENNSIPASALAIDANTGVITTTAALFTEYDGNTFDLDIGVTNDLGSVTFPNAFTIEVSSLVLLYNPSAINITTVTAITSPTPVVSPLIPPPYTFAIANAAELNAPITIAPNTGVISATETLALEFNNNTYHVHVSVTDGSGTVHTQNNAYNIFVNR